MSKNRKSKKKITILISAVLTFAALAIELCLLTDFILMFCAVYVPMRHFMMICAGILIASGILVLCNRRAAGRLLAVLTAALCIGCASLQFFYRATHSDDFLKRMAYRQVGSEKEQLFSGKKVMLLVPHEDDDLNILCGVIDEYLHYGSDLTVAFVTNGDYWGLGEVRIREALALYGFLGVPEDHIVFLGYGDELHTDEYHIYNAPGEEVITSRAGKTETYGIDTHPPFRPNHAYTKDNLYADMKDLILSVRPDILFCVDYDSHVDHRACSMMFEKVMGEILKTESDYSPEVFKGFAYCTAWGAEPDFFKDNIGATLDIYHNSAAIQTPPIYRWEERVRFPVKADTLSRSLQGSELYDELLFYQSQEAHKRGARIINGDKVFWRRSTDSLCREASLSASSGNPSVLNDFMLLDSRNILDHGHDPYDGVWSPEDGDQEKTIAVSLNSPAEILEIVLYDNPDPDSNILNAEILFDDGSMIETGPLDVSGAPSRFRVATAGNESTFQVKLTATEGNYPGLMEIEAFRVLQESEPGFLKIMDSNGDFAYDYIINKSGSQSFLVYSDGIIPDLSSGAYEVECENVPGCGAEIRDGLLFIQCAKGQNCTVSIRLKESGLADSIYVRNPTLQERITITILQKLEFIRSENIELLHLVELDKKQEAW